MKIQHCLGKGDILYGHAAGAWTSRHSTSFIILQGRSQHLFYASENEVRRASDLAKVPRSESESYSNPNLILESREHLAPSEQLLQTRRFT